MKKYITMNKNNIIRAAVVNYNPSSCPFDPLYSPSNISYSFSSPLLSYSPSATGYFAGQFGLLHHSRMFYSTSLPSINGNKYEIAVLPCVLYEKSFKDSYRSLLLYLIKTKLIYKLKYYTKTENGLVNFFHDVNISETWSDHYISYEDLYNNDLHMYVGYDKIYFTLLRENWISNLDLYIKDVFEDLDHQYFIRNQNTNHNNIVKGYTIIKIFIINPKDSSVSKGIKSDVYHNNTNSST